MLGTIVPEEFIDAYNLHDRFYKGLLYVEICQDICELPQA